MSTAIVVATYGVAVAAAVRSTWSPCGLSMLSSITPIGERGRGHTFAATAAWFVIGAVLGGATLGAALFALAAGVAAVGAPPAVIVAVAAVVAVLGATVDLGLTGVRIPFLRRQVNEVWLDQFRSWVYGAGFGWQIGVGFSTYVMTAAVIVTCALAALTASPWVAFGAGVAFGAMRGLTVFLGATITDPSRLLAAHRGLDRLRRPVWVVAISAQLVVAGVLGALAWWPAPVVAAGVALLAVAARLVAPVGSRRRTPMMATGPDPRDGE